MAYFDEAYFNEAFFDDEDAATSPKNKMNKVKLDLRNRDDNDLKEFATVHRDAMVANDNFPVAKITPTPAEFDPVLADYTAKLAEHDAAQLAAREATQAKDLAREAVEGMLNGRRNYVDGAAKGSAPMILSAKFGVTAEATPTTSLPQVGDLRATMGDMEGEIDLVWDSIKTARNYVVEDREHRDGTEWKQARIVSRSRCTVSGLDTGKTYAFRVAALGPNDLQGPWSDEAVKMAP